MYVYKAYTTVHFKTTFKSLKHTNTAYDRPVSIYSSVLEQDLTMAVSEILSMPKTIRPKLAEEKHSIDGVFTRSRQRVTQLNREESRKLTVRLQNLKKLSIDQTEKLNRLKKQMAEKVQNISAYQAALEKIRVENFECMKATDDGESSCTPDSERRRSLEFHLLRYGFDCPQMKMEIKRIRQEKDPKVMRMRQVEILKAIEKSKSDLLLSRRESNAEVVNDFRRRRSTVAQASSYKLTEVTTKQKQS